MRVTPDLLALEVKDVWNGTAGQRDEREQRARPLVAEAMVHLDCEQHGARAPDRAEEGLGCEGGRGLVLVGVDEIVVGRVVEEDESEADGEAAHCRAPPAESRVRGPGEDEEADWD